MPQPFSIYFQVQGTRKVTNLNNLPVSRKMSNIKGRPIVVYDDDRSENNQTGE